MEQVDCVVIGAGVVGLACAAALAEAGREVWLLEREDAIGTATSARNSEVIHAGLSYPPGSLKARLCVRGKELLYAFCARHGVGHRRCGKLVVAGSDDELSALAALQRQAAANGVDDLRWLDAAQTRSLEPALACTAALLSPSTGIVDSHGLMQTLLGLAEQRGAQLLRRAPVEGGRITTQGIQLQLGGADPCTVLARSVVNAAGLQACALARRLDGLDPQWVPQAFLAKGDYFSLSGRAPFRHLVYPVPSGSGHLGVHLTLDLAGQARFGPSFEWVDREDYRVDARQAAAFEQAVRRYWPELPADALQPDYAGIRPRISGPGQPAVDFRIDGTGQHGVAGLVNLFGIESPGLTASLAIGERVASLL